MTTKKLIRRQLSIVRWMKENARVRLRVGMSALVFGGTMAILGIILAVAGQIPYDTELLFAEILALDSLRSEHNS